MTPKKSRKTPSQLYLFDAITDHVVLGMFEEISKSKAPFRAVMRVLAEINRSLKDMIKREA